MNSTDACNAINNCNESNGGCGLNSTCRSTGPSENNCTCIQGYHSKYGNGTACLPNDSGAISTTRLLIIVVPIAVVLLVSLGAGVLLMCKYNRGESLARSPSSGNLFASFSGCGLQANQGLRRDRSCAV